MTDEEIKRDRLLIARMTPGRWFLADAVEDIALLAEAGTRWTAALDEIERTRGFVEDARRFFVAERVAREAAEQSLETSLRENARLRDEIESLRARTAFLTKSYGGGG